MKIYVIAGYAESLINFRGPLLSAMVKAGHEVVACAPGDNPELVDQLSEMGVTFQAIPLQRTGMNPFRDIYLLFFLILLLRKNGPDILLAYTIKPVIYGSLAGCLAGIPYCFSMITGLGSSFQGQTLKRKVLNLLVRFLYKLSLSKNRAIFIQNPDDLSLLVNLRLVRKDQAVLVNGSGVDLEHYRPTPVVKSAPVFLLISRLIKEKGILEYVEAARKIKIRHPEVIFRLVGWFDSNPTAIPKSQIEKWHHEGVIEYCGHTKDVRPFISASSVYVLPSYYREGTPRSTLEAMAMGRPIITTDAPGCRETVMEGKNGFLVPINNVECLAKAMERFILEPDIIGPMGHYSRELAEEKYDVNKVNAVIMETIGLHHEKNI